MRLLPILPWPVIAVGALVAAALLWLARARLRAVHAERAALRSWWRRAAVTLLVVVILLGPTVRATEAVATSNVEIYLVVDRTGSMAAEDWAGAAPQGVENPTATRLDGVRSDLAAIRAANPAARYSVLALDSAAAVELPLSTDTSSVDSWTDALTQEVTQRATGSSLELALPLLSQTLAQSNDEEPDAIRLVYLLSDGEDTDGGAGAAEAASGGWSWASLEGVIDGGAVLGYGTAQGGPMRSYDGSPATGEHTNADYITDPGSEGQGAQAVSVIDEDKLRSVASDLGLDYVHRTGGSQDDPTDVFADVDLDEVVSEGEGERSTGARRYVVWPLGLGVAVLLMWEMFDLARSDRRLRALAGRGSQGGQRQWNQ